MLEIKPQPYDSFSFQNCKANDVKLEEIIFYGMHVLARCYCQKSNQRFYHTFKARYISFLNVLFITGYSVKTLPAGIEHIKNLDLLNVQDNKLTILSPKLKELNKLTAVNLRGNQFKTLLELLLRLPNLREIDLVNNPNLDLTKAIHALAQIKKLDFLYLSGNNLSTLPRHIINLNALEELCRGCA